MMADHVTNSMLRDKACVIRKDAHGILFGGVQFNERAAAEQQHLMDGT